MQRQKGMTFITLVFVLALVVIAAIIGMKTVPAVIEYFTVKKVIASMAHEGDLRGGDASEIRKSFDRRANIAYLTVIQGSDLDIRKDPSGGTVVSFAYEKKIPLFGPASLVFDFKGSSAPGGAAAGD